ncbi:MAG: SDR family oxidoreductase [Succinivibrio sp.]|nr:SDR family oxidoreductase [Succinivibrio sp.]
MNKLKDKNVLVTGGTSGIGEAIVRLFAEEGASVAVVGRNKQKGQAIVDEINESSTASKQYSFRRALFFQCDVTQRMQVLSLKEDFLKKFNKLDVLVNSAGILKTATLNELGSKNDQYSQEWLDVFNANTHSVMFVTSIFMDLLVETKGSVVTNASIDGLQSLTRGRASYAYSSSKAAVIQFSKLCALNYADKGVRINCLCPGVTDTSLFTNRDFSRFTKVIPMNRVATPLEIAKSALFLASDDASYITGSVLTVDGGASLL